MRRPIEIMTKYLADSRDGLERLIKENTKGKRVVKVQYEHVAPSVMFGRFVARVITSEMPTPSIADVLLSNED